MPAQIRGRQTRKNQKGPYIDTGMPTGGGENLPAKSKSEIRYIIAQKVKIRGKSRKTQISWSSRFIRVSIFSLLLPVRG